MTMPDSPAMTIALDHIHAWSTHDWETTREWLAPNVHVVVTTTQPMKAIVEFTGVDQYMERKIKAAQLIEPGSAHVISKVGDDHNALILVTMRIGLGPGGTMVTLARAILYALDEHRKIAEERDEYFILADERD